MSTPCDWVASKLEAFWTLGKGGTDATELLGEVRSHARTCPACARELEAYETVDRLVRAHFASRMTEARTPVRRIPRVLVAATTAAALLLAVWIGMTLKPSSDSLVADSTRDVAGLVIDDLEQADSLAKPSEESPLPRPDLDATGTTPAADDAFSVIDAAGYAHKLTDFRGSVVVLGVFDATGTGGRTFREVYETVPAQSGLSFLAVRVASASELLRSDLEGIPTMANQGSRLLGIGPGEFAVLDREGRIHTRGSLAAASPDVRSTVQSGLTELGFVSE
jgi:hypothetical protein